MFENGNGEWSLKVTYHINGGWQGKQHLNGRETEESSNWLKKKKKRKRKKNKQIDAVR